MYKIGDTVEVFGCGVDYCNECLACSFARLSQKFYKGTIVDINESMYLRVELKNVGNIATNIHRIRRYDTKIAFYKKRLRKNG